MCWLQKHFSLQSTASEYNVPLECGQGVSHKWNPQSKGKWPLPSWEGRLPDTLSLEEFSLNVSQEEFMKTEAAKSRQVRKCDSFPVVCRGGSEP